MTFNLNLLDKPIHEINVLAFDTETTGAYPVQDEIVEFGSVLFSEGAIKSTYQSLFKPKEKMSDFIIKIHGITNEDVANCESIDTQASAIHEQFQNVVSLAHHAPFDVGFVSFLFEKNKLSLPRNPILCSSLLSRALIPSTTNHKLQTLVEELNLEGGTAHRAAADAKACLQVFQKCLEKLPATTTLKDLLKIQAKSLDWKYYSLLTSQRVMLIDLVKSIEEKKDLEIVYGGSNSIRKLTPLGIVRSPDGDFLPALCHNSGEKKRFYLQKFKDWALVNRNP
jgi:DNA polymerase-3 subunit epsilon